MKSFYYKAKNIHGEVKKGIYKGELNNLKEELRTSNYYIISNRIVNTNISFKNIGVSYKDISMFSRDLYLLIKSGIGILEIFNILFHQYNKGKLRDSLNGIYQLLISGNSLSESFSKYDNIYPKFFISMIKIGEESGKLEEVLYKLSEYYAKEEEVKNKFKNALIYPIMLIIAMIISLSIILFGVLPSLGQMLKDMNINLPWYTEFMIESVDFLKDNKTLLLIILMLITIYYLLFVKVLSKNKKSHLAIKLTNKLFKTVYDIRFIRALSILISSGLSIIQSLYICTTIINSSSYKDNIEEIIKDIRGGASLSLAFNRRGVFAPLIVSMIRVGEESGTLDISMEKLCDILSAKFYQNIDKKLTYIQPTIIIFMAVLVGFIIIVFMMPMLNSLSQASSI